MGVDFNAVIGYGLGPAALPMLPQLLSPQEAPRLAHAIVRVGQVRGRASAADALWYDCNFDIADLEASWPWDWMAHLDNSNGFIIDALGPGSAAIGAGLRWWDFIANPVIAGAVRFACRELAYTLGGPPRALCVADRWDIASDVQARRPLDQIIAAMYERAGPPCPTFATLPLNDQRDGKIGWAYYVDDFSLWPDGDEPPDEQ